LQLQEGGFVYVTLHRPSNVDDRGSLSAIVQELSGIGAQWPVIFPIHPRTRGRLREFDLSFDADSGVRLLDPIGYYDSLALTKHARCVLTDSGGLQEESTFFGTPCLTLRPNTERPVTIRLGTNRLTRIETLGSDLDAALADSRQGTVPPLWDGRTAERILDCLLQS
jgi:UDP-N-acetylglucosamine 2-epimerase (non-hydrolysing)